MRVDQEHPGEHRAEDHHLAPRPARGRARLLAHPRRARAVQRLPDAHRDHRGPAEERHRDTYSRPDGDAVLRRFGRRAGRLPLPDAPTADRPAWRWRSTHGRRLAREAAAVPARGPRHGGGLVSTLTAHLGDDAARRATATCWSATAARPPPSATASRSACASSAWAAARCSSPYGLAQLSPARRCRSASCRWTCCAAALGRGEAAQERQGRGGLRGAGDRHLRRDRGPRAGRSTTPRRPPWRASTARRRRSSSPSCAALIPELAGGVAAAEVERPSPDRPDRRTARTARTAGPPTPRPPRTRRRRAGDRGLRRPDRRAAPAQAAAAVRRAARPHRRLRARRAQPQARPRPRRRPARAEGRGGARAHRLQPATHIDHGGDP